MGEQVETQVRTWVDPKLGVYLADVPGIGSRLPVVGYAAGPGDDQVLTVRTPSGTEQVVVEDRGGFLHRVGA